MRRSRSGRARRAPRGTGPRPARGWAPARETRDRSRPARSTRPSAGSTRPTRAAPTSRTAQVTESSRECLQRLVLRRPPGQLGERRRGQHERAPTVAVVAQPVGRLLPGHRDRLVRPRRRHATGQRRNGCAGHEQPDEPDHDRVRVRRRRTPAPSAVTAAATPSATATACASPSTRAVRSTGSALCTLRNGASTPSSAERVCAARPPSSGPTCPAVTSSSPTSRHATANRRSGTRRSARPARPEPGQQRGLQDGGGVRGQVPGGGPRRSPLHQQVPEPLRGPPQHLEQRRVRRGGRRRLDDVDEPVAVATEQHQREQPPAAGEQHRQAATTRPAAERAVDPGRAARVG